MEQYNVALESEYSRLLNAIDASNQFEQSFIQKIASALNVAISSGASNILLVFDIDETIGYYDVRQKGKTIIRRSFYDAMQIIHSVSMSKGPEIHIGLLSRRSPEELHEIVDILQEVGNIKIESDCILSTDNGTNLPDSAHAIDAIVDTSMVDDETCIDLAFDAKFWHLMYLSMSRSDTFIVAFDDSPDIAYIQKPGTNIRGIWVDDSANLRYIK
jgi:hypothetical protein